jgi:hypothetical protein
MRSLEKTDSYTFQRVALVSNDIERAAYNLGQTCGVDTNIV